MANKHIEHLEDYVFTDKQIIDDFLSSVQQESAPVSLKWDGAPAIVFGLCPVSFKFFMGTKSIFNKTPIVYYSISDIWEHYGTKKDLFYKLAFAFNVLEREYNKLPNYPDLPIYQADILFISDEVEDLMVETFENKADDNFIFRPNTIMYSLEQACDRKKARAAKIGLAIHTEYFVNKDNVQDLNTWEHKPVHTNDVFSDAVWEARTLFDVSCYCQHLPLRKVQDASEKLLPILDTVLISNYMMAYNDSIKRGDDFTSFDLFYNHMRHFIKKRMCNKIMGLARTSAIETHTSSYCAQLRSLETHKQALASIWNYQVAVRAAKHYILDHTMPAIEYIISTSNGHEGLVYDHPNGMAKLVNRSQFSRDNFQKNSNTFEQK